MPRPFSPRCPLLSFDLRTILAVEKVAVQDMEHEDYLAAMKVACDKAEHDAAEGEGE